MDNLTRKQRKLNMQRIQSKGSKLEQQVAERLRDRGIKFRKNVASLPGTPDIVLHKKKVIVFIDSCFWHFCRYHGNIPKSNTTYWLPKLRRNRIRDKEITKELQENGWLVIRIWEHSINRNIEECIEVICSKVGV